MITIKFTKVFTPQSTLYGLTYKEVVECPDRESANLHLNFLKEHTTKPVKTRYGSNYTIKDIVVS